MSPPQPWLALRHHRTQKNLSVPELAELAGLSKSYLEHLEAGRRGNPRPRTLNALATALEVTVSELRADYALDPAGPQALLQLQKELGVLRERVDQIVSAHPALQDQEVA